MRMKEVSVDKVTTEGDSIFQLVLFLIMGAVLALVLFLLVGRVFASQNDNVTICHKNNGNGWSKITVDESAVNGQGNGDHNDSQHQGGQDIIPPGSWDSNGRNWTAGNIAIYNNNCNVVVPTATPVPPTPTVVIPSPTIPQPTIIPCDGCCEDCEPTVTPEPTREPEVTPVPQGLTHTEGNQGTGLVDNSCHELSVPEMPQDLWYTNYQVANGTASLVLHWGTNAQYGAVHIVYGEHIGQWSYAALNVPNNGQFTIGGLKPHQTYWFQVAYVRGCAVGQYSHPVDP